MKEEIEAFEFLKAKSCIKGIHVDDLQSLLTNAVTGKRFKNYSIKMMQTNAILINDSNNMNKNTLFKCIKDFYQTTNTDCTRIRTELGTYNVNGSSESIPKCSECYLKYIEKLKNGEL